MNEILPILVVDDEPANLMAIEYQLKKNNYLVDTATNGIIALEKFKSNEYSLILLDVMMPQLDGFQVCDKMQEINPNIPVILITALSDDLHLKKGFDSGAWDYINKPWTEIQLISRIKKALKISLTEKQNLSLLKTLQAEFSKQNIELKLAGKVQKYLLPKWVYLKSDLLITSVYNPSEMLGGDIFDIISLKNNKYLIYIGDISGHGIQAALLMTAVKSIIRLITEEINDYNDLSYFIKRINDILVQQMFHERFLTLLIAVIDTKENTINSFSAGHPPQIKIDYNKNDSEILDSKGILPLGWLNEIDSNLQNQNQLISYKNHESFLFYTDGIYECLDKNIDFLGINSFNEKIKSLFPLLDSVSTPEQIKECIQNDNYDLSKDDVAVVNVSFLDKYKDHKDRVFYTYETNNEYEFNKQLSFIDEQLTDEVLKIDLKKSVIEIIRGLLEYVNKIKMKEKNPDYILISIKVTKDQLIIEVWIHDFILPGDVICSLGDIMDFSISSIKQGNLNIYKITISIN